MKKTTALFALLSLGSAIPSTRAEVSVDFFYESLEPHGEWLEVGDYGYVWHPNDIDEDWRPYTVGQWAYTDAGWTWVSEEPHGWATHHYGRWVDVEPTGWVWVPGTEWGPAWVSWRRSERHVGWAPLPPEATFRVNFTIGNWADSYYDIGPAHYSFVEVRHLGAPRIRAVILPPRENIVIVRETRNITNITYRNNIVINEGPVYNDVVRVSAEPIRRLRLDRRTDIREGQAVANYRTRIEGDSLSIAAPAVVYDAKVAPKRVARKIAKAEVNRGWRGAGAAPQEMERLRATVRQEAKAPADLPPQPKFEREERSSTATSTTPEPGRAGTAAPRTGRAGSTAPTAPGATSTTPPATTAPDKATTTTPADSTTTPKPGSTTPAPGTDPKTRPGARGGLRDPKAGTDTTTDAPGRPGRAGRPDASTPPETTTPEAADRPGRPAAKPPGGDEKTNRPGREAGPDAVDRPDRGGRRATTGRPESPGASATPGSPDPATTGRPEAPGRSNPVKRPESPGRSDKPGRAETDSETERPSAKRPETPARTDRPDRPDRPERPARPDASDRPSRSESPTLPETAKRPASTPRPARAERPAQADRDDAPPKPRGGADRPSAAVERPKAERPAAAERPARAAAARARTAAPKPTGAATTGDEEEKRGKKKKE